MLGPLLTPDNGARLVDRDGRQSELVAAAIVEGNRRRLLSSSPDPLARFAREALAIVIDHDTASAGQMLAIAFAGEPRVRSFGRPSYGATTANVPVALPDDATLLATRYRYAIADAPPIRGPVVPQVRAADDESPSDAIGAAASWVAARSSRCRVPGSQQQVQ